MAGLLALPCCRGNLLSWKPVDNFEQKTSQVGVAELRALPYCHHGNLLCFDPNA